MPNPLHCDSSAQSPRNKWVAACGLVFLLCFGALQPAGADQADHDRAQQALQAGQVLPLQEVLLRVRQEYPGQVLAVELEEDDGLLVYEIKLLQAGGQLVKLKLDARTALVLKTKIKAAKNH